METVLLYTNFGFIVAIVLILIFYRKIYWWPNYPYNNTQDNIPIYFKCIQSWSDGKLNFAVLENYETPVKTLGRKLLIVKTKNLLIPDNMYEIINDWDTYYRNYTMNENLQML